ncbi:MAG: hypothetical protein QM736_05090 [Vicinamibacterales bacterium]
MTRRARVARGPILLIAIGVVLSGTVAGAGERPDAAASFAGVQELFYSGRYTEAAAQSQLLSADDGRLAVYELRTTALLFQLRRAIGEPADKDRALKACEICPGLLDAFAREFEAGRTEARAVLRQHADNPEALFYLGKLDLNFVWLHLGTLGRRTGWNEYWEARHSLDAALARDPTHLRARVARAWIDYIVDTKMPWGTGWLLGGGNRERALAVMREAVTSQTDVYTHAEALFGLWDMLVREKNHTAALEPARELAALFPENAEVARYIAGRTRSSR